MRRLLALLLALPLAGCVIPTDPVRLAAQGPATSAQLTRATRPLQAGDTVALVVQETSLDRGRLEQCIAAGIRSRLPSGVTLVALDAPRATTLGALVSAREVELGQEATALGAEWAVLVRDATAQHSASDSGFFADGGGGGGVVGVQGGTDITYSLRLEGLLLDLRGQRRLGQASAVYSAHGGGRIAAGIVGMGGGGGGIVLPFVLPIIRLPGGTSAMAICNAFGRSVADALVRAAATPPAADAAVP